MSEKQFYLLQVNDALFPIGGYSHSQGLETYIQRGIVHDADTAREYITHKIKWNLAYTELLGAMKPPGKMTCQSFWNWKKFWKPPGFPWSKERLQERWAPVLPKP